MNILYSIHLHHSFFSYLSMYFLFTCITVYLFTIVPIQEFEPGAGPGYPGPPPKSPGGTVQAYTLHGTSQQCTCVYVYVCICIYLTWYNVLVCVCVCVYVCMCMSLHHCVYEFDLCTSTYVSTIMYRCAIMYRCRTSILPFS